MSFLKKIRSEIKFKDPLQTENNRIKIMHFVHSLNEGGIERLLYELCRKINSTKFEIQICCIKEEGLLCENFRKLGITVFALKAEKKISFINFFRNVKKLFFIRNLLIEQSITITHGHEFYSTIFSRISALIAGVKLKYITLHNVYYWWSNRVHLMQRLMSYITTKVICNSNSTLMYSLKHDKISPEKYELIYNGIDTTKFIKRNINKKQFLKEFGFEETDIICMSVGNLSFRKGFQHIIETADKLRHENKRLKFLIVGGKHHEEDTEYNKLTMLITKHKLENIVKITGQRNDVETLLNICDLYIMPSVAEGFGLALAEAMSTERLVLVSDIEPFMEIVTDGDNGFTFRSGNSESLAEKVRKVLTLDDMDSEKIRINARKTIIEKFSLDQMVRNYESLYQQTNITHS